MGWAPPRLSLSRADTGTYRRTGGQKSLFSTAFKRNAEKQQRAAVTPQDVGNSRTGKTPVIRGEITLFFQQHTNLPCRGMTTCKTGLKRQLNANTSRKKEEKKGILKHHLHLKCVKVCCPGVFMVWLQGWLKALGSWQGLTLNDHDIIFTLGIDRKSVV